MILQNAEGVKKKSIFQTRCRANNALDELETLQMLSPTILIQ
jgi:hypothetical protein